MTDFKKIKVSEASGAVLDWLVAKCEDALHPLGNVVIYDGRLWLAVGGEINLPRRVEYAPSTDPAQAWPIIERERVATWCEQGFAWSARIGQLYMESDAPTSLIAAMRCYIASKLGETVEVPKELISE